MRAACYEIGFRPKNNSDSKRARFCSRMLLYYQGEQEHHYGNLYTLRGQLSSHRAGVGNLQPAGCMRFEQFLYPGGEKINMDECVPLPDLKVWSATKITTLFWPVVVKRLFTTATARGSCQRNGYL